MENRTDKAQLAKLLAGMEGGTVGVLWMLAWLGVSSVWQQRSFWTPENLMSTAFDRNATLAPVFTWATCGGMALYVLIYSLLGVTFAAAVPHRVPRKRVMLLAVIFALSWYYLSFHLMFKFALPLVAMLHVEHTTIVGHLLYGTMLGRYPLYFDRLMGASPPLEAGFGGAREEDGAGGRNSGE
jgi:hypothetical protein